MTRRSIFPFRSSAYWDPDLYRVSAWTEHVPFGFWLTDVLAPTRFVELGTYHGMSYLAFCQAIKRLKLSTHATAIDTWSGDVHAGPLASDALASLRRVHDFRYGSFSTLMQSRIEDAVSHFHDESIDLLHIDALHSYEAVRTDFETWLPKVSKSKPAIVLFHDTQVHEADFGVYRLWAEVASKYPSFEFHHGHGLGVLGIGSGFSPELNFLFESESLGLADWIRAKFANLGHRQSINARYQEAPFKKGYYQMRRIARSSLKRLSSHW
jgi:hypothetical protein